MSWRIYNKPRLIFLAPVFILFSGANFALAAGGYPNPLGGVKDFKTLVENIGRGIPPIALALAVAAIILVGLRFVWASVSGGNEQELVKAKKIFWWVLIGSAVAVGAAALAQFLTQLIGKK